MSYSSWINVRININLGGFIMARQRKLSPERKEFLQKLLSAYQPKGAQDVQNMLKDLFGDTLQTLLEAEMDEHLGYSKYDYKNKDTDDSRNGYSKSLLLP